MDKNYTVTKSISKCTHWLAKPDDTSIVKEFIIPGKAYEMIDGDLILSEDGNLTAYWMTHKGIFIKMKKEKLNDL
jgi:hypothetical protein